MNLFHENENGKVYIETIGSIIRLSALQKTGHRMKQLKSTTLPAKDEIARLDAEAKEANDVIDKMERVSVKGYLVLGKVLLKLRPLFPGQWEKHLKELGVDQTRWKRAKAIAEGFGDEKELDGIRTLDEALKQTRFGHRQPQHKTAKKSRAVARKAPAPKATEDKDAEGQAPVTAKELDAVKTYVAAVGGWTRAKWLLVEGEKKWKENQQE